MAASHVAESHVALSYDRQYEIAFYFISNHFSNEYFYQSISSHSEIICTMISFFRQPSYILQNTKSKKIK